MATSSTFTCGVCDSQHTTKDADHWCPECEEGLCPNCLIFHNSSKLSRGHDIISIENYKELPQYIRSIRQHCPDHDRKYQHYCASHEVPCCPFCMTTSHRECKGLQVLEEVVKTSELTSHYEDMKQSLRDIQNNIERIKIDRERNLKCIQEQRSEFQYEIKQVREQINSHLDKLEKQAIENLESTENRIKHQIVQLLRKLSNSGKEIEDLKNIVTSMKNNASDLQRFLGKKQIESDITKSEKYINSLVEDGSLQQVTLNRSFDSNVSDILSSISSFCTISTATSKTNILLKKEKEKQAQIMTVPPTAQTPIHDIKVQLIKTFTLPKRDSINCLTGCTINKSGKMIFTDYLFNKRLVIINADGTLDRELNLSAYDVTSIDERRVAVLQDGQIQIIDLLSKEVETTIKLSDNIHQSGISYGQDKLLYCDNENSIQTLKLSDRKPSKLIDIARDSNWWNYLEHYQNNIYHTNKNNNTVTCYKISGEKLWEFRDDAVICSPCSVSVDKYSNVYVASEGKGSIVVLSSDGTQSRTLINNLKCWAIDIDKERNVLMVANYFNNIVEVYKIK